MGNLANQAHKQAIGIISGTIKSAKALEIKKVPPTITETVCPGRISMSKKTSFDFVISAPNYFGTRPIYIPANSYWKVNEKLKQGWKLSTYCELVQKPNDKSGRYFAKIFVTKQAEKPKPLPKFLGVDVGIKHGVARSDNYLGCSLSPIMISEKNSQKERQRQQHPK